ncbi:hypothetical protein BOO71_0002428 [Deinococcus marmoris]|uniref:Uncharacterized protein n=1 Tax=Deinococcus marmoris TaxID=249408 RepID=A0A1U7P310_9DEIO|nr:hypothetical protein BOO71_0002428 [Deinococcus marmoris]
MRAAGEGETNCSHIDHNPDDLSALQALCPRCHRANDKVQQSCAAALTLICEGRMVQERLKLRLEDLKRAVSLLGLPGVTPGGADLAVVLILHAAQDGSSESELKTAFRKLLGGLAEESDEDVRAVIRAALIRLRMRRVPVITTESVAVGGPLIWSSSGLYWLQLEGSLTLPGHITEAGPGLWEEADRQYRYARNSRYARR